MSASKEPIGVIGVGWVGLVTATCFAELGHPVVAVDVDEAKIGTLRRGEPPIHEPRVDELLSRNAERLIFTTEIAEALQAASLLFVCVDTPPTYSGDADLSRVQAVVAEVGADGEHVLVMKSTVPAGTGAAIKRELSGVAYVSCPEFLREGTAVDDFLRPDRVVIGADPDDAWAADAVAAVYEPLGGELVRTDVASAEMIKLASNAFLATKISFINEIANVSEEVGADVSEVARGMGLDKRIGPSFLRAGIGYGGSCVLGEETVLVRRRGHISLRRLDELFALLAIEEDLDESGESQVVSPEELEVLAWEPSAETPEFLPVALATRRRYEGEIVEVRTKMGRRLRCTPDHPFVTCAGDGGDPRIKLAEELTNQDWLPIALGIPPTRETAVAFTPGGGMTAAGLEAEDVIVRPAPAEVERLASLPVETRRQALGGHPRGYTQRSRDIVRAGALRLNEALDLRVSLAGAAAGTARNGTYVPFDMELDEEFWRVVGLYIAEGHCNVDGASERHRLQWSFHHSLEDYLVDEVASFWRARGVKTTVLHGSTSKHVSVSSKLLARWWLDRLGLGANCYEQRVPNAIWSQPAEHKRALMTGAWLGDGSWSFVAGGPSVTLEYGTVSWELADGLLRLLGEFQLVASVRVARTSKSTTDTFWLTISGADQIEQALFLVPVTDRDLVRHSISRQSKRIAPTGYRRHSANFASVRVTRLNREWFSGHVYSLEVPGAHTFVTSAGLVTDNCFPKDVSSLKQLAGNTGYHFQLLTAVIEVNELQKRRVLKKLEKHLGSLAGKQIALLGLAFKPDTDDMREASSLVLASRLEGEGATVRGYDPVAETPAREMLPKVQFCESLEDALDAADAAILVTEWPEFAEADWASLRDRMANPLLIDGRNFLDPAAVREAGLTYEGIGRASAAGTGAPLRR
jgi:UDPglucose 6-dehydrogenase